MLFDLRDYPDPIWPLVDLQFFQTFSSIIRLFFLRDKKLFLTGIQKLKVMIASNLPVSQHRAGVLLQGYLDVLVRGSGALGDGPQGLPEGGLVEGVGAGGLGGELRHLLDVGLVGLLAFPVVSLQDAGLLVTEGAGAGGRFQEVGEGHVRLVCSLSYRGVPLRSPGQS